MNHPQSLLQHLLLPFAYLAITASTAAGQMTGEANLTIEEQAHRAGLIFTAVVTDVHVSEAASMAEISFRVTDGIRGVNPDEKVTVREWTGTWNGQPRYRVGEMVLAFFFASGANGFTSPVGGSAGILRFANSSTLKFSEAQQRGLMRSPRFIGMFGLAAADARPANTVLASSFVRALRLVVESQ